MACASASGEAVGGVAIEQIMLDENTWPNLVCGKTIGESADTFANHCCGRAALRLRNLLRGSQRLKAGRFHWASRCSVITRMFMGPERTGRGEKPACAMLEIVVSG